MRTQLTLAAVLSMVAALASVSEAATFRTYVIDPRLIPETAIVDSGTQTSAPVTIEGSTTCRARPFRGKATPRARSTASRRRRRASP